MCKKQTSVSHSSTESEIILLDAGKGMDGSPALDLWDLTNPKRMCRETCCMTHHQENTPRTKLRLQFSTTNLNYATPIMFSSNVKSSQFGAIYTFEDNEAVIKMIIKGRSPTMRHLSRTHRIALDWFFDTINHPN